MHTHARLVAVAVLVMSAVMGTPSPALADRHFMANLTGGQQVPPSGSAATGNAIIELNAPENFVLIWGTFSGLGSNQVSSHIHGPAGPGVDGPIILTLGTAGTTSGGMTTNVAVTPAQAAQLRAGLWYIDVHSVSLPGGEIRGQMLSEPHLVASGGGAQVVPPVATGATVSGFASLDATETVAYFSLRYQNLPVGNTGVHVHGPAGPGADGPIVRTLGASGPAGTYFYANFPHSFTPTLVAQLKAGLLYLDVHSAAYPGGEIRGQLKLANKPVDFDADSRAEIGVFRPSSGVWYLQNPATNVFSAQQFGASMDAEVPADYDGDGRTDLAVYRNGTWYVLRSSDGSFLAQPFGIGSDVATPGDYDGDGRADFAVYRPGSPQSYLYILQSSDGAVRTVPWGTSNDRSLIGDFDGDLKTDVTIYRPSTGTYWILRSSDNGVVGQQWGVFFTDWISPSDYDGDAKTDMAVFRFSGAGAGTWYILQSSTGTMRAEAFGASGDISRPVDYDGDGKTDLAVTRAGGGAWTWYVWRSSSATMLALVFGLSTDVPVPQYLIR